jgi:pimeloyl-ACP methyl ester carboxylesterase
LKTDFTPFRRGAFSDLPERPRRPHPWFDAPRMTVEMSAGPFSPIRVVYRVVGEGPPLLLVHGLMTSSYSWRYVLEGLGRAHRLYVPDLPGCGETEARPDRSHAPGELAAWILGFQRAVGIRGCAAVGNSMGGYLCMRAALDDPGAYSRLVDIHSPGVPQLKLRLLHAALATPGAPSLLIRMVHRDPERWAHRNVHYYDESLKSLEEAREYARPLAAPGGAESFVRYLRETLAPGDMAEFVKRLAARRDDKQPFPTPLLLLYSTSDPLVSPSVGKALHALIPDAELAWIDKTSHFAHVDTPEAVIAAISRFVDKTAIDSPRPESPSSTP